MHNEEYIASGVLELYAAGGLTPTEREEVEARAAASAEVRAALDEACATMETYASQYARAPRAALKQNIMAQVRAQKDTASLPFSPAPEQVEQQAIPLYPERESSPYKWMFAASIALFLISGLLSMHFYNKWQDAESRLGQVIASERLLAQNVETASLRLEQQEIALSVFRNPDYKQIKLAGVDAHPDANMTLYWNPENSQVFIDQMRLPAAPAGKQYQLWALDNGTPVDAGVFSETNRSLNLQQMKAISSAQAFAVTLEPTGGSVNPTLEQLMVMGKVES
ncbi:anti-sigma factor [Pontibacter qinzhouensis]|uniref:Anti-sigma factor n=1 Tax=Pontibacter qinzhouensis TaxID=2603253 RepID=A0A5C8KA76_9BACT|nr:anti-sigma factor [Pontibacter qinzhouensis]TXK45746.1 anti-sigma factor [Pontibacter qinzhouensis]